MLGNLRDPNKLMGRSTAAAYNVAGAGGMKPPAAPMNDGIQPRAGMPRAGMPGAAGMMGQQARSQAGAAMGAPMAAGMGRPAQPAPPAPPAPGSQPVGQDIQQRWTDMADGKNPAMDQARRTTESALGGMQKNLLQGAQRTAVQAGAVPGSAMAKKLAYDANNQVLGGGSAMLGQLQQKGLDGAAAGLTGLTSFHEGQQRNTLDEGSLANDTARVGISRDTLTEQGRQFDGNMGQRKSEFDQNFGQHKNEFDQTFGQHKSEFDQTFGQQAKNDETKTLFDIINNPASSEGQVSAAKGKLGQLGGFNTSDPNGWGKTERTNGMKARDEMRDNLIAGGMDPAAADAEATKRFGRVNNAEYDIFNRGVNDEMGLNPDGSPKVAPDNYTFNDHVKDGVTGAAQLAAANYGITGGVAAVGKTAGEVGRGFRDIGRGDVVAGTGRVIAAPVRGVSHGVAQTARGVKKGGKKVLKSIGLG